AEGFKNSHLADSLAHTHRQRVCGDQENRERDRASDRQQKQLQVAEERDEAEGELLFGFRLRRVGRVSKHLINGAAHARNVRGSLCLNQNLINQVAIRIRRGQTFTQVVVIEEEQLVVIRVVEDAYQREFEIRGPDVACERYPFTRTPAKFIRQLARGDAGCALTEEGFFLVFRNPKFGMNLKQFVRPDREAGEEVPRVARVTERPAEPLPHRTRLHSGNLLNLLFK